MDTMNDDVNARLIGFGVGRIVRSEFPGAKAGEYVYGAIGR